MNLYIFNENRRGTVFGIGTYIQELTMALKDSEIHLCVINLLSDKLQIQMEEREGVSYWYFPAPISEEWAMDNKELRELYFRNIVYLLQLHIKDRKDLVFHFNYHQNGSFIDRLKEVFDCKIVMVVHFSEWGFTVFDNLPRLRIILCEEHLDNFNENVKTAFEEEKSDYTKVDHVICLSSYMQETLYRDYGLDLEKITVIPNGLSDVAYALGNNKLLREKWHIQMGEKIILFAGRIDEVKGVRYLIKAFHNVLKINLNSRLFIVGNGNFDIYFQEAKNACAQITVTGLLEKTDLYELYQIADVGVVPSLFEPFGYVPVEMMIHRLPIVATATSGLDEVVDDTCGVKVPIIRHPDKVEIDTDLLAEKILYLLEHPEMCRKLGKNGRKKYEKMYSSEIFAHNMLRFYRSLVKQ